MLFQHSSQLCSKFGSAPCCMFIPLQMAQFLFQHNCNTVSLPAARRIHLGCSDMGLHFSYHIRHKLLLRQPGLGWHLSDTYTAYTPKTRHTPAHATSLCLIDSIYATFRPPLGRLIYLLRRERVCHFLLYGRRELRSGGRKGERIGKGQVHWDRDIHTHTREATQLDLMG